MVVRLDRRLDSHDHLEHRGPWRSVGLDIMSEMADWRRDSERPCDHFGRER